jgi:hypothetical protein
MRRERLSARTPMRARRSQGFGSGRRPADGDGFVSDAADYPVDPSSTCRRRRRVDIGLDHCNRAEKRSQRGAVGCPVGTARVLDCWLSRTRDAVPRLRICRAQLDNSQPGAVSGSVGAGSSVPRSSSAPNIQTRPGIEPISGCWDVNCLMYERFGYFVGFVKGPITRLSLSAV